MKEAKTTSYGLENDGESSACTTDGRYNARIVEDPVSACTTGGGVDAASAGGQNSACTTGGGVDAASAGGQNSACTTDRRHTARIVEDPEFATMEGNVLPARIVEDPEFATMEGNVLPALNVEEERSVNTDGNDVNVPSAPTRQSLIEFAKYVLTRYWVLNARKKESAPAANPTYQKGPRPSLETRSSRHSATNHTQRIGAWQQVPHVMAFSIDVQIFCGFIPGRLPWS